MNSDNPSIQSTVYKIPEDFRLYLSSLSLGPDWILPVMEKLWRENLRLKQTAEDNTISLNETLGVPDD